MKIKPIGHSSFSIQGKTSTGGKLTVVTDPFDPKKVGLPYPKQDADVVTVSHQHDDHNWVEGVKNAPFVVDTPGEYELSGLRIFGIHSFHDDKEGENRGPNTIYVYDFKEARVAHLGDLGHTLNSDQQEALEFVDVLLVPVGGFYTIDPKTAMMVIESIEPKIVIPMHYKLDAKTPKLSKIDKISTVDDFLKEANGVASKKESEFTLKSYSDLPHTTEIVVLE